MPGDCLVVNDSRVLPARLYGVKRKPGRKVEFLLLTQREKRRLGSAVRSGPKRAKPGSIDSRFGGGLLTTRRFWTLSKAATAWPGLPYTQEQLLLRSWTRSDRCRLPHYITAESEGQRAVPDRLFQREIGSAAAPTAGLHFTPELLEGAIRLKGRENRRS